MKISILCDSLLLKNSLEIFLKDYIASYKNCDIVISDKKIQTDKYIVLINSSKEADIQIPFSKSTLLMDLKKIYENSILGKNKIVTYEDSEKMIWKLERKIDKLTLDFRENLINTIREFYEK